MKYVSVTSPGSDMSKPIFNYFEDYLVSLGEPVTSDSWDVFSVLRHVNKILNESPDDAELYIDSGGFQIIVGYVKPERIKEFITAYHYILKKCRHQIDQIFGLDVYSDTFMPSREVDNGVFLESNVHANSKVKIKPSKKVPIFPEVYSRDNFKEFYDANEFSITSSINLIKEFPEISDKQLFILQTSNIVTFNMWKELFLNLEVYKYYKRWSIGGLVGLKKTTNVKFSHAVPATLWLLTYQRKLNFSIDQVHWLGQSSRLSFLSMALFERLYNINMTSDSSQLVRFAPLEAKLPYLILNKENDFELINDRTDIYKMFDQHSLQNNVCYISKTHDGKIAEFKNLKQIKSFDKKGKVHKYSPTTFDQILAGDNKPIYFQITDKEFLELTGKLDNQTFIEFQSQNLFADMKFGDFIVDKIMEIGIDNITEVDQLKDLHPVMARGRTAKELLNNIEYFKEFKDIIQNADTDAADNIMQGIVEEYKLKIDSVGTK